MTDRMPECKTVFNFGYNLHLSVSNKANYNESDLAAIENDFKESSK